MNRTELLKIRMETPNGLVVIRSEQAIVGLEGIFVTGVRLPAGTCVRIRLGRGKNELDLKGIACADRSGGSVTFRWEGMSDDARRKLVAILAAAA